MSGMLDILMSQILLKMSVISEQQARAYDGITVQGGEKDRVPHLDDKPLVDYYRDRYAGAKTDSSRRQVVLDAVEALKVAKRMPIPEGQPPTIDDPQWKRWVVESGLTTTELVRLFGVSRQYLHQVRRAYGTLSDRQV